MKKLLALVLALVMTMSLVTISNAAFKDADKIDYDEAVEVMNAVGVLVGDEKGNFNAKDNLTREQAAKIISYLLLGNKTAEALVGAAKFTDVAATRWSAGFVDYCASTGVVAGNGNGTFAPAGQLTGFQFAKMLLVALGYDAKIEGFTGTDWQINVSKVANQVGLFNGLSISGTAVLTREQGAQMCLNTLKAPLVEYSNKGGSLSVNGATINIGASKAEYVTTTLAKEQRISDKKLTNTGLNTTGGYTVEFGEKYYPALELKSGADDFGRPAHTWLLNNQKVGTYPETADYEYTTAVTGKDLYNALGKNTVEKYDFSVFVDGAEDDTLAKQIAKDNKDDLTFTGKGALTQVFVDNDAETVIITVVNTYLAQATADYSAKKDSVTLKIYGVSGNKTVSGEDYDVSKLEADDFVLVTYSYMAKEVKSVATPETIEDTAIDSFKSGKSGNIVVAGTKYSYNKVAQYDADVLGDYTTEGGSITNLKDVTYNVYLDQYGYVIGVEEVEAASNYVFITGVDYKYSSLATQNVSANAIFMDGTSKVIDVKNNAALKAAIDGKKPDDVAKATVNKWFTYTVNSSDVYTLSTIADVMDSSKTLTNGKTNPNYTKVAQNVLSATEKTIDKKNISLAANGDFSYAYGNDATVYLAAKLDTVALENKYQNNTDVVVIKGVDSVTTGVKNVSIETWTEADQYKAADVKGADKDTTLSLKNTVYFLYKDNGYILAAVVLGDDAGATKNLVYVNSSKIESESYSKTTGKWTWTREVIFNGEKVTLTESNDTGVSYLKNMDRYSWYQVKFDAKDLVVGADKASTVLDKTPVENAEYVDDAANLGNVISKSNKDTILYEQKNNVEQAPSLKGNTLFFAKDAEKGVVVADDVKYVFIQKVDNKIETTIESGSKALKAALDDLDNSKNYDSSAIIENGIAKVVIVRDVKSLDGSYTPGTGTKGDYEFKNVYAEVENGVILISATQPDAISGWQMDGVGTVTYTVTANGKVFTATQELAKIQNISRVAFPGLSVNNGSNINVEVEFTFTGLDGNAYSVTGSAYIL